MAIPPYPPTARPPAPNAPPSGPPPGSPPPGWTPATWQQAGAVPPGWQPVGWPQGYAPYPAPAKSDSGVIIAVVLVVVVLVFMIPVLYVLVSGISAPASAPEPNLVLTAGTWTSGNLTIAFASITNAAGLDPQDLTYTAADPSGTTYFSGAAGTGSAVAGTAVTVNYQDNGNFGIVSPEDNLRLTVSPADSNALRGGSFRVFFAADVIGFINQLP